MIYPFVRVPVPSVSSYVYSRNGKRYLFAYVGERKVNAKGKSVHPDAKMIGRIETNSDGVDELMPNERYYELMGIKPPESAVKEGSGRKPSVKGTDIREQKAHSERSFGYGFICLNLFAGTGILSCLEKAFGSDVTYELMAMASYLADGPHSSFSELNDFVNDNMCLGCPPSFDRRRAGELLVKLSPQQRGEFYTRWNDLQHSENQRVFYDVTSFSTYSGLIQSAEFGYNRDAEDLRQVNQGLFCSEQTGLPLYMCSYEGSLNDAQNFSYALRQAKEHHLFKKSSGLTIVIDGGFSSGNFNWAHMEKYKLIAGVSVHRLKEVREKYLAWARSLTMDDLAVKWEVNDSLYVSRRTPITIGGVEGELVMYLDLTSRSDRERTDHALKVKKEVELKELKRWPGKDFDNWARSFKPYFKVLKAKGRRGFTYTEDTEGQAQSNAMCGAVTLFTTCKNMTDEEIMRSYREKEMVEDCFDTTKNGLSDKRLHVHGDAQLEGKMFVMFLGLILTRLLRKRLKPYLEQKNCTLHDVIRELKKITYFKNSKGKWLSKNALTRTQKEIISCLDLEYFKEEKLTLHPRVRTRTAKAKS